MFWSLRKKLTGRKISILLGGFVFFIAFPLPIFADGILAGLLWKIVNLLFGWMVWLSGTLLDYTINYFVVGFGDMYITTGLGVTIDRLWESVRDIFNLAFIFGLVFIGLKMIFKSDDSGAQKLLVSLIIAALLVNFSLFITKFVVDFSNIAATQVTKVFPKSKTKDLPAVSEAFAERMGLNTTLSFGNGGKFLPADMSAGGSYGYIFGTMIIYIIATFVFMGGALLLAIRFAALNIYMLLSPLMFIGMIFPGAQNIANEYWKGFLSRAFFAPAYLLMLYFSYQILEMFTIQAQGKPALSSIFDEKGSTNFASVVPPFVLTSIFLIASIVVAQKMSATGGSGVINMQNAMMNKLKGGMKKGIVGSSKWAGGYVAKKTQDSLDKHATGRGALSRIPMVGSATKWVAQKSTVLGARDVLESAAKPYTTGSDKRKKRKQDLAGRESKARAQDAIDAGTDKKNVSDLATLRAKRTGGSALSATEITELDRLEDIESKMHTAVNGLTTAMMEEMTEQQLLEIESLMSSTQIENLIKSDKVSQSTKDNLVKNRQNTIKAALTASGSNFTKEITKLTDDQIEIMGAQWIKENVHMFSKSQMDNLMKSKKFAPAQRDNFNSTRTNWHKAAANGLPVTPGGPPADIKLLMENRKPADVANMGKDVLLSALAPDYLDSAVLEEILKNNTLGPSDRAILAGNIALAVLSSPTPKLLDMDSWLKKPNIASKW